MNLDKLIEALGEGVNVVHKLVNGGGIFSLLSITDELAALGSVSAEALKAEIAALTPEVKLQKVALLKSKINISNKVLEAKIEGGADVLNEAVDIVYDGLAVVAHGKALVEKAKVIFG